VPLLLQEYILESATDPDNNCRQITTAGKGQPQTKLRVPCPLLQDKLKSAPGKYMKTSDPPLGTENNTGEKHKNHSFKQHEKGCPQQRGSERKKQTIPHPQTRRK
jgi:hypothetical protein